MKRPPLFPAVPAAPTVTEAPAPNGTTGATRTLAARIDEDLLMEFAILCKRRKRTQQDVLTQLVAQWVASES